MTSFARFDCGYYHEDPLGNVSLHCDDPSQHAQFNPAADPAPRWGRSTSAVRELASHPDSATVGSGTSSPELALVSSRPEVQAAWVAFFEAFTQLLRVIEGPTPPPTKRSGNYPTGPRLTHGATQSQIRDWARTQGLDVNPRGTVRRDIADAYAAAHQTVTR